jgi:hypothetical protein
MKKWFVCFVVMLVVLAFAGIALAEDKMINGKVERVFLKKDKNGNPFTVLILKGNKELQGVTYRADLPFFCFGDSNKECSSLKAGQSVKLIINERPAGSQVLKVVM